MLVCAVCANGKEPMICQDSCTKHPCASKTGAVCAADPCNSCHTVWYDMAGQPISDCQGKYISADCQILEWRVLIF